MRRKKKLTKKGGYEIFKRESHHLCTLVKDNVGKETPIKNPKTTPTKVVTMSFILSFGFLVTGLQPRR